MKAIWKLNDRLVFEVGIFQVVVAGKAQRRRFCLERFCGKFNDYRKHQVSRVEASASKCATFYILKMKIQSDTCRNIRQFLRKLITLMDGDPSTFSMNLKVLRPKSGPMMELVQYDFNEEKTETESSGDNE